MKPIELDVGWLPGNIRAITLWPFIAYLRGHKTHCIRLHEHYHWNQALRYGVLPWYALYLLLLLKVIGRPISDHELEKEAYRIQWDCEAISASKPKP